MGGEHLAKLGGGDALSCVSAFNQPMYVDNSSMPSKKIDKQNGGHSHLPCATVHPQFELWVSMGTCPGQYSTCVASYHLFIVKFSV